MQLPALDCAGHEWFALQVRAGREQLCARQLQTRGYAIFLPCYQELRRWSDRLKQVRKPLFAGYLFCRVEDEVLGLLVTTPGVIRIVGDGRRPLPITSEEVDAIRRVVDSGAPVEPWEFVQVGRRVRVHAGPLRDTEGIVLKVKNRHRLVMSVSVLQRSVAVDVDLACVETLSDTGWRTVSSRAGAPLRSAGPAWTSTAATCSE
jgi:transcription antitermination factor NusG